MCEGREILSTGAFAGFYGSQSWRCYIGVGTPEDVGVGRGQK